MIKDMIRFLKIEYKKRKDEKECIKIAKIFNN